MDIPDCMTANEIRISTLNSEHPGILSEDVLHSGPSRNAEVKKELKPYWSFRDEITVKCRITKKGRRIIVPASLQGKALKQLHLNHVGIEKTRLLTYDSVYWINMNTNIEETVRNCPTHYDFQLAQPKDTTVSQKFNECQWNLQGLASLQLITSIIFYCRLPHHIPHHKTAEGFHHR